MDEPEIKIIDVFICKLRKKLADAGVRNIIGTVWGRGYILKDSDIHLQPIERVLASSIDETSHAPRLPARNAA